MEEVTEGKLFATFEKLDEFENLQQTFLSVNLNDEPNRDEAMKEFNIYRKLCDILDEYQEQSYLLDPFLEQLVTPVIDHLKSHAKSYISSTTGSISSVRVDRLSGLLYQYIKSRGHKTIIRFFPHEIADMTIALDYITLPNGPAQANGLWSLRYVVLLWLSLICMIPFDFAQLDDPDRMGEIATKVEAVAKLHLGKAGLERDGAASLLSRFYMRKDARFRFHEFLVWAKTTLESSPDLFMAIGILQVLCEIIKSGPSDEVQRRISAFFAIPTALEQSKVLEGNTVIRKLNTKLLSRLALRILPAGYQRKGRLLVDTFSGGFELDEDEDEADIPEEIESILEGLFKRLQDRDTIVRWSAAKGTARIASRLPSSFADQVLDTIIKLFSIHSLAAANIYDLPAIAESTWHGACLALAEMARRGLVSEDKLLEVMGWLSKALYFDIRKGAHSIGSSVRDAAAYVLWALARAQEPSALEPHAINLARRLATVSLFDREIHIRRAASAAYQEHVGRMSLFPHGIDILRKTDFYAVSVRRNAFLVAAPQVAEHPEYRPFLIDHLLSVTLRHWDISMRVLGAQSLRMICELELGVLGPACAQNAMQLLDSADVVDIHGSLLALTELADAYQLSGDVALDQKRRDNFSFLSKVSMDVIQTPRNEVVAAAACALIASSITKNDITQEDGLSVPHWRKIVDVGLRHRSRTVQEAGARAMAAVSKLVDCSSVVERLIREFRSGSPTSQQSLGRLLGVLDYNAYPHGLSEALECLLESVSLSSPKRMKNIEARCNCYLAMPQILLTISSHLSEKLVSEQISVLFKSLLDGLDDYSLDERGDVGSWIRMACIRGLTNFVEILFNNAAKIPKFEECFPAPVYHAAIAGILKQGVERLDNVRQTAGEHLGRLLLFSLPPVEDPSPWRIEGDEMMKALFLSDIDNEGWKDGNWLFPRAVKLLVLNAYRSSVLAGLILSVGTRTDSTRGPVSSSLVTFARTLPLNSVEVSGYSLISIVGDLATRAKSNMTSNAIVIPVLQTLNILLEGDVLDCLVDDKEGLESLEDILSVATSNIARLKSVPRILEAMKLLANMLPFDGLSHICVPRLKDFLAHAFPKIRTDTAEYLYLVIQSKDLPWETNEVEEVLLETEWSSTDITSSQEAAQKIVQLFSHSS